MTPAVDHAGGAVDGEGRGRGLPPHPGGQRLRGRRPTRSSPTPTWWPARAPTASLLPDGRRLPATVVLFDADRDLALLKVPALGETPLPLARRQGRATTGAVFGHPGGQDRRAGGARPDQPGRSGPSAATSTTPTPPGATSSSWPPRSARRLRRGPRQPTGAVVGVAFAIAPDKPGTAYALSTKEVTGALGEQSATASSTGTCLAEA